MGQGVIFLCAQIDELMVGRETCFMGPCYAQSWKINLQVYKTSYKLIKHITSWLNKFTSLDSNIEWGISNNTFIKHHWNIKEIQKFSINADKRKQDFLSAWKFDESTLPDIFFFKFGPLLWGDFFSDHLLWSMNF